MGAESPGRADSVTGVSLAVVGALLIVLQLAITALSGRFQPDAPLLGQPIVLFVTLQTLAGLIYLAAVPLLRRGSGPGVLALLAVGGLLLRGAAWAAQPILEDDFHRYLWDGATSSAGASPYRFAPAEILEGAAGVPERLRLEALAGGDTVARINHPGLTTIYPPVAQAAFLLAHLVGPFSLGAWKAVLLLADLAAAFITLRLLTALGQPQWLLAVYWWNPLLIKETYSSAHMDVLLLPLLLGALLARIHRRPFATALLLALATGVKLWPALLAPLLLAPWFRRSGRRLLVPLVYAAVSGLLLSPMLARLWAHSGLVQFTGRWEMNDALFAALSILVTAAGVPDGVASTALRAALAAALLALAGIAAWRDNGSPEALVRGTLTVTAALFLTSPAQFPWYFTWLVPILALLPFAPLLVLTVTLPLYYLRFDFAAAGNAGFFDNGVVFLEWAPVWGLLLWALLQRTTSAAPPRPAAESL
jgi:hypothetical protein